MKHWTPSLLLSVALHAGVIMLLANSASSCHRTTDGLSSRPSRELYTLVLTGNPTPSPASVLQPGDAVTSFRHPTTSIEPAPQIPQNLDVKFNTQVSNPKATPAGHSESAAADEESLPAARRTDLDRSNKEMLRHAQHDNVLILRPASIASAGNIAGQSGRDQEEPPSGGLDPYLVRLRERIEHHKQYPALSRRAQEEGEMVFRLMIDTGGRLTKIELVSSASSERLTNAARRAIENAAPFDPPPSAWPNGLAVSIPIRFSLRGM